MSLEVFYVVFQKTDHKRAWDIFSPPGFRHVFLIKQIYLPPAGLMAPRYSLKYEALASNTDIDFYWIDPRKVVRELLKKAQTSSVLRIQIKKLPSHAYIPRGIITCVSSVKAILGIRPWWVITPRQLWKYLLNNSAREIKG